MMTWLKRLFHRRKPNAALTAKIVHSDGTVTDLGTIIEGNIEFTPKG